MGDPARHGQSFPEPADGDRVPAGGTPNFVALVGPTAVGKTGVSLALGRRLPVEIISMDSRQIYRGLDIGTAKATLRERGQLRHHGLDLRDPDEVYSAGEFARDARRWAREIRSRGRAPLLVGGTGFFLRALIHPLFREPPLDPARRRRLRRYLATRSDAWLRRAAERLDRERADILASGGRQRLARAVEMAWLTGRPLSWWHRAGGAEGEPAHAAIFLLLLPREILYERINRRARRMLEQGFVEEVERFKAAGLSRDAPGMTGAGYREVWQYLEGEIEASELEERIARSHRRYARRQLTWFRHQLPPHTTRLDAHGSPDELAEEIADRIREAFG